MELADIIFFLLIIVLLGITMMSILKRNGINLKNYDNHVFNKEIGKSKQMTNQKKILPLLLVILVISTTFFYSKYYVNKTSDSLKSDQLLLSRNFTTINKVNLNSAEKLKLIDSLKDYKKQLSMLLTKLKKQEFITGKSDPILLVAENRLLSLQKTEISLSSTDLLRVQDIAKDKSSPQNALNEYLLARQQNDRIRFWAVAIVAGLLLMLVGLLVSNVKRKAKTNDQLTNLNAEVSRQKDNLDRINHHLEDIIDERTKDLLIKNKKLSETINNLKSQINNPYLNLRGMIDLKNEELVSLNETFKSMKASIDEMDDFISDLRNDVNRVQTDQ